MALELVSRPCLDTTHDMVDKAAVLAVTVEVGVVLALCLVHPGVQTLWKEARAVWWWWCTR